MNATAAPATATKAPKPARAKYVNDGSLESVEDMLVGFASAGFARVSKLGLPMTFDDVLQEFRVGYLKARAVWQPERGKFITLCHFVARQHFNHVIERMAKDRTELGLSSVDALFSDADEAQEDGYSQVASDEESDFARPEDRLVRRAELQERLSKLSPTGRRFVRLFIQSALTVQKPGADELLLGQLAAHMGLTGEPLASLQREVRAVFDLPGLHFRKVSTGRKTAGAAVG